VSTHHVERRVPPTATGDALPNALILVENNSVPADSRVWPICLSLRQAGWDVTVVCPRGRSRDSAPFERLDGVEIHRFRLPRNDGGPLGYLREYGSAFARITGLVRRLSSRGTFDVVHACSPPDFLLLAALGLRRRGTAMIFDHHDLSPELYAAKYDRGAAFQILLELVERTAFALADASLATNESFREVAITRGHMKPDDVFVVRNGPDTDVFKPVDPDQSLGSGAPYLIGYVGAMNSQDGVELALDALSLLRRRRSDWHAIFVGDGEVTAAAESSLARLGIEDCVTFTGFVGDQARLVQIIASCDVCLSPEPRNTLNENSTLIKVAEYMAVARPVVAFDLRETRRTAGDAAAYAARDDAAAFAEAVDDLLSDRARRERMGALGRERARTDLSWARSVEALLSAYDHARTRSAARVGRGFRRS
jgi:glycosyltransferase involved in cell wall biosynthesis